MGQARLHSSIRPLTLKTAGILPDHVQSTSPGMLGKVHWRAWFLRAGFYEIVVRKLSFAKLAACNGRCDERRQGL